MSPGPDTAAALPRPSRCRRPLLLLAAGALLAPMAPAQQRPATGAVILVDRRLHEPLATLLADYAAAAGKRRGFAVEVAATLGLDDEPFAALRERVRGLRAQHPALEGVLFVGNVKLPSLYSPRGDNLQTRYFVHALEDLDLGLQRRLEPGSARPGTGDDPGRVPEHDFDRLERGGADDVELWAAFLPVGFGDAARDHHAEWARQLEPFLRKAIAFHRGETPLPRRLYKVSNQLWDLAPAWRWYGPARIDFYAVNPLARGKVPQGTPAEQYCRLPPAQAYVRAPLQRFDSYEQFADWYRGHEWMGEGWQQASIFLAHMNERAYDVAWLNVHSNESFSLATAAEARKVSRGALVMLLSGCGVGGFRQPGNPSFVDTEVAPEHNVLCAWVYGGSTALAALGDPFNRGHESYFERIVEWLTDGDYLGRAHRRRMELHHQRSASADELKENLMEILVGDPFVDLRPR